MIKYLQREVTEGIRLFFNPEGDNFSKEKLELIARRSGKFNLGYHYILRKNGDLEKGIEFKQYADSELDGYKTLICVMVTADKLTDASNKTLNALKEKLNLPIV